MRAWSDAQIARTRAYLDALPGRDAVAARLGAFARGGSSGFGQLRAAGARLFAMYSDPARQQPALVTLDQSADPATRRPVLDPEALDPSGHTEIDWFVPSPDGARVAVSLSQSGGEDGMLHVYPALARAVVSSVGIYDMIRSVLAPNGAFAVTEYGSVRDPAQFRAILA